MLCAVYYWPICWLPEGIQFVCVQDSDVQETLASICNDIVVEGDKVCHAFTWDYTQKRSYFKGQNIQNMNVSAPYGYNKNDLIANVTMCNNPSVTTWILNAGMIQSQHRHKLCCYLLLFLLSISYYSAQQLDMVLALTTWNCTYLQHFSNVWSVSATCSFVLRPEGLGAAHCLIAALALCMVTQWPGCNIIILQQRAQKVWCQCSSEWWRNERHKRVDSRSAQRQQNQQQQFIL